MGRMRKMVQVLTLILFMLGLTLSGLIHFLLLQLQEEENEGGVTPQEYETMDEDGIFHIYTGEDMRCFLRYVHDGYGDLDAVLEADIDMGQTRMFGKEYRGHLNGQGYSVTGLVHPLFRDIEIGGLVENLNIVDAACQEDGTIGMGAIAHYNYGTIQNCTVSGEIIGEKYTGGIVSVNMGRIENSTNYADIYSTGPIEEKDSTSWMHGYGAGGIAGISGTSRRDGDLPDVCAIVGCRNYGKVTAQTLAGGIVGKLDDRTEGSASNYSVQALVETSDFEDPLGLNESGAPEYPDDSEDGGVADVSADRHFSLTECQNYGEVTVERRVDDNGWYVRVAGICGDLDHGDLYRCANLGVIGISEDAPKVNDSGWIYTATPYAIAETMGFSPEMNGHIMDCVNLEGTLKGVMRHENVMELTEQEMEQWLSNDASMDYISDNWEFSLEEAAYYCSLEPFGITGSGTDRGGSFYLCDAFALSLPEYFSVEEVFLEQDVEGNVKDDIYALHLSLTEDAGEIYGTTGYECWILHKEADVMAALQEAREYQTRDDWRVDAFIELLYGGLPNIHVLDISSIHLPFHANYAEKDLAENRIVLEDALPDRMVGQYMREGNHVLGNVVALPLEGNYEDGLHAEWLMVFTTKGSNIRPDRAFVRKVEDSFYPLDGNEDWVTVRKGDSLWRIAQEYTGSGKNWELLAAINGRDGSDLLLPGEKLVVPDCAAWERRPASIDLAWLTE